MPLPFKERADISDFELKLFTAEYDKLADMLCRVMAESTVVLSGKTVLDISNVDDDIVQWWESHKKWDAEHKK